jgi:hypothetical protein
LANVIGGEIGDPAAELQAEVDLGGEALKLERPL